MVNVIQSPAPLTREAALDAIALVAALLFAHGQTTERTIVAAERLGRALGVPVTALPYWGQLTVEIDGTTVSKIVPVKPLGVDMGRVLAVTTVMDQVCYGTLEASAARSALALAGRLPPVSTLRFTLLAAIGAASLGVIFGVVDAASPAADRWRALAAILSSSRSALRPSPVPLPARPAACTCRRR